MIRHVMLGIVLSIGSGMLISHAWANIDTYTFTSPQQEQTYRSLTEELRCPKCQNNSIADSNAVIATDMRAKVYELLQQGNDKQQVVDYMVARYGHFVTYQPPVTPATLVLWLGPLLFLVVGSAVIWRRCYPKAKRRAVSQSSQESRDEENAGLSHAEQQRLEQLLSSEKALSDNNLRQKGPTL